MTIRSIAPIRPLQMFCAGLLTVAIVASIPAAAHAAAVLKPACSVSGGGIESPLVRVREALQQHRPLTIVAIGSSSTFGAGASSAATSYPSRLAALLQERFPGTPIRVLNRGVNGEEEPEMLARFARDVIAEKPDLVLWQVGANAVLRGRSLAKEETLIRQGVERLKAIGTDVALIDLQYTPEVLSKPGVSPMVDLIAAEARRADVGLVRRFEMMKDWRVNTRIPFLAFSASDGVHMNDWGYDCFARNLAASIIETVTPPVMASVLAPSAQ